MKKFTKKQRREIYLKAIKAYFKRPDNRKYLCGVLADVLKLKIDTIYHVGGGLPEFDLFEPTKKEREGSLLWWSGSHYDDNRINCLLFCAEMCR